MAVDTNAEIAAEHDAVARFFEKLQKQVDQERDDAVTKAVVELLTVAVVPITGTNGEKWECKMCAGRNDHHTKACPMPALERWINRVGVR